MRRFRSLAAFASMMVCATLAGSETPPVQSDAAAKAP